MHARSVSVMLYTRAWLMLDGGRDRLAVVRALHSREAGNGTGGVVGHRAEGRVVVAALDGAAVTEVAVEAGVSR